MAHGDLNVLSAFLAVAEERSFTNAAKESPRDVLQHCRR